MHILPRKALSVKKAKYGLDRVEKFYDDVKVRSLFGWGNFMILLVTGTLKKKKQDSIPFLTPF
jgi:hypothetical protein